MLFNSLQFLVFLPVVFIIYWTIRKSRVKKQNLFVLLASYVFYGWWDYRFLSLIIISTLFDFFLAKQIVKASSGIIKKRWLVLSLLSNLGMLMFFKYYNFFIDSWVETWSVFGIEMHRTTLNIILPVGISFYTFQTLSYTIDVYRDKLSPSKSIINFAAFVSFFPQLVAGPIERATNLLPQFEKERKFDYGRAVSGLHLIAWGLFKKIVIADSCAQYVNAIFSNYEQLNGGTLILGAVYFSFQIYGDFSGYSDIAIGVSRLFGFELMRNFNFPYFSRSIAEFWRRWHISLSTWFRDYLYIPLGGSKGNKKNQIRNVFIVFIVSGFWHGANWTFIFWGLLNALYFLPLLLTKKNRLYLDDVQPSNLKSWFKILYQISITFTLTTVAWVFFRSDNIYSGFNYLLRIVSEFNLKPEYLSIERYSVELLLLIFVFVVIEWFIRFREEPISGRFTLLKLCLIVTSIFVFGSFSNPSDFIYFQF